MPASLGWPVVAAASKSRPLGLEPAETAETAEPPPGAVAKTDSRRKVSVRSMAAMMMDDA